MSVLQNRRIVITRPPYKAQEFAQQLRWLGATPIILPLITIHPLSDTTELDAKLAAITSYDRVILTSSSTVRQIQARFDALNLTPRFPKIAVIGTSTAKTLQKYGIMPDIIPCEHTAEALFDALSRHTDLAQQRIFLPQSDLARPILADLLRGAGAVVDTVAAYQTVSPQIDAALLETPFDAITFTSSSTVNQFMLSFDNPADIIRDARIACIGPVTAETAHAAGLRVHAVASTHSLTGLIDSLIELFQGESTT